MAGLSSVCEESNERRQPLNNDRYFSDGGATGNKSAVSNISSNLCSQENSIETNTIKNLENGAIPIFINRGLKFAHLNIYIVWFQNR